MHADAVLGGRRVLAGRSRHDRWRRSVLQRGIALLCLVAAAAMVMQYRVDVGRTTAVVVTTRDLPAGSRVTSSDLTVRRDPAAHVPTTAVTSPEQVVGRTITGPVGAGEVVTTGRLVGPDLLAGLPADRVALPVPLVDPAAASVVRPGDRVDLYLPGSATPVTRSTLVLAQPGPSGPEPGSGSFGVASGTPAVILVAVTAAEAGRIVQADDGLSPTVGVVVSLRGH